MKIYKFLITTLFSFLLMSCGSNSAIEQAMQAERLKQAVAQQQRDIADKSTKELDQSN